MKKYMEIQIGTSVYTVENENDIVEAIKSIVIHNQGQLSSLQINPIYDEWIEWKDSLLTLNNHINSLTEWNDYAESQQREYDNLLSAEPTKYIK